MGAMDIGALLIAAALLAKSGILGDVLPGAPPKDFYGLQPPTVAFLSFAEWQKLNPGGSSSEYYDYQKGV